MGWFDWFKAPKTIDKIVDGAISAGDKLFYTDEEKADFRLKVGNQVIKFIGVAGDENSIRSKARRILAILIVGHELLFLDLAAIAYIFSKPEVGKLFLGLAATLAAATTAVVIFYFGYYGVQNIIGKIKDK